MSRQVQPVPYVGRTHARGFLTLDIAEASVSKRVEKSVSLNKCFISREVGGGKIIHQISSKTLSPKWPRSVINQGYEISKMTKGYFDLIN